MTRKSKTEAKKRPIKNTAPKKPVKRRNPNRKKGKLASWKHRWGVSNRFIIGFIAVIALVLFVSGLIGADLLHKHFASNPLSGSGQLSTRQPAPGSSPEALVSRSRENAIQMRVSAKNEPKSIERGTATQSQAYPTPRPNRDPNQELSNQAPRSGHESRAGHNLREQHEKGRETVPLSDLEAQELLFEEQSANRLEDAVKRVDRLLLEGLDAQSVPYSVSMNKVEWREHAGDMYHFQRLIILFQGNSGQKSHAVATLRRILDEKFKDAHPATSLVALTESRWYVSIGGTATHELLFSAAQAPIPQPDDRTSAPPEPVIPPGRTARLVLLIDDIGESKAMLREFLGLDIPMAFAVLPHSAHARESAAMITQAGHELLLHHPMEPERFPAVKPGPGAVYAKDTETRIAAVLADNLSRVPGIQGLNNHMGSKFTGNARAVELFVRALSKKGLFIVDSLTSPRSKLYQTAEKMGIKAYRRDVFLDDVSDRASIRHELDKAARLAQSQGQALAIGHPRPETLAVLKEWLKSNKARDVVFCRLQDLN